MKDLTEEFHRTKSDRDYFKLKHEQLEKSNQNKDELITQVKDNIQDMRGQREALGSENQALKTRVEQMQLAMKINDEQVKAQRDEIRAL